jgi:hypothetical protein
LYTSDSSRAPGLADNIDDLADEDDADERC